jgi:hypothetical protein
VNVEQDTAPFAEEVERGQSGRTPFLALGAVMIVIAALFLVSLCVAVLAYILA